MRTQYSGSRRAAQSLLVSRMVEAGWPEEVAESIVAVATKDALPMSKKMTWTRKRRAIERDGSFDDEQFKQVVAFYGRCLRCERDDVVLVPDHIVPLFRGGRHHLSNIQPLCAECNLWKGQRMIDFRLEGRISEDTPIQSKGKALE